MIQNIEDFERIENIVENNRAKIDSLYDTVEDLYEKLEETRTYNELILKVRAFFQNIAEEVQQEVAETICTITTSALFAVFPDDPYECKIRFKIKRNILEAELYFERDGEEFHPVDDSGGGVIDVAAFAARVSFIFLSGAKKLLIADEPFKFVSKDYLPKIPEMLRMLSEKLNMQFIIVSHIHEIIEGADNVIKVK
jgi:DNA repair exonuclease SbcCD ATPase subunit